MDGKFTIRSTVTRGRLTRGAQLTVGYTVNTYSKPPLYYTLGTVAPLLPCLRTAAVLRTAHTVGPGGPLPQADRQTLDRHDLPPTNQPTNQPFCQYPAVSWEIRQNFHVQDMLKIISLKRKRSQPRTFIELNRHCYVSDNDPEGPEAFRRR